jgi:hypothetical protein
LAVVVVAGLLVSDGEAAVALLLLECPAPAETGAAADADADADAPLFDGGDAEVVLGVMYMGALGLSLLDDIACSLARPATEVVRKWWALGLLDRSCPADKQSSKDEMPVMIMVVVVVVRPARRCGIWTTRWRGVTF